MEGCFPLCNSGLPLPLVCSFCYMLPPYSHLHLDLGYATISPPPPPHLLLIKAQIYKILPSTTMKGLSFDFDAQPRHSDLPFELPLQNTMISLSLERPPPEPPPQVNCLSHMTSHTTMTIPPSSSMTSIVHACDNFNISPDLTPVTTPRAALLCSLRPPPEPPPCSSPSILRFVSAPCPPSLSSLVRPPRKPPDKFRIDLKAGLLQGLCFYCPLSKPPWVFLGHLISVLSLCLLLLFLYVIDVVLCIVVCILFLCLIGFKLLREWSLDSRCHTSSVGLYEDGSSFTALCLHQLIFVQRDKVKKSETMCSRNVRDEAKEMIRNWIGKKTLGSHLSFVSFRRWKMLNELIGYEIWIKFSCLSPMLMCTANPVVIVFFPCIGTSKLLGITPSMITLAACNHLYFMKC